MSERLGLRLEGDEARQAVSDELERLRIPIEVIPTGSQPGAPLRLTERITRKSIEFALGAVREAEEARNPENGSRYLRVTLDDGRHFALSTVGIVFMPSFEATGPQPDCPPTACFLDYAKLHRHLTHLADETHEQHRQEAIQVLMVLLAFLEGARRIGFEVSEEERDLETLLAKLERRSA